MERYHIFKLGLAILFYAAYCIRPMVVNGQKIETETETQTKKFNEEDLVFYQGVQGKPGVDFPVLSHIPRTSFNCREVESGYYADLETDCQVFHICEENKKISFLCPNGTIFEQSELICEWWFKVNCTNSPSLYEESAEHLREENARRKLSRRVQNHGAVMRTEERSSVSKKASKRVFVENKQLNNHASTHRDGIDTNDLSRSSSSDFVRDQKDEREQKPVQFQKQPTVDNEEIKRVNSQRTGRRRPIKNEERKSERREKSFIEHFDDEDNEESDKQNSFRNRNPQGFRKSVDNQNQRNQFDNHNYRSGTQSLRKVNEVPLQSTTTSFSNRQNDEFNRFNNHNYEGGTQQYLRKVNKVPVRTTASTFGDSFNNQNRQNDDFNRFNNDNNEGSVSSTVSSFKPNQQNNDFNRFNNHNNEGSVSSTVSSFKQNQQNNNFNRFNNPNYKGNTRQESRKVNEASLRTTASSFLSQRDELNNNYKSSISQVSRRVNTAPFSTTALPNTKEQNRQSDNFNHNYRNEPSTTEASIRTTGTFTDFSFTNQNRQSYISKSQPFSSTIQTFKDPVRTTPSIDFFSENQNNFNYNNQAAQGSVNTNKIPVSSTVASFDLAFTKQKQNNQFDYNDEGQFSSTSTASTINSLSNNNQDNSFNKVSPKSYFESSTVTPNQQSQSSGSFTNFNYEVPVRLGAGSSLSSTESQQNNNSGTKKPVPLSVNIVSSTVSPQKKDFNSDGKITNEKSKSTVPLTKNDIANRRLEPSESDESQIPQETASFYKNSFNRIDQDKKYTLNPHPNHRETYSELKEPKYYSTKTFSSISSVTPQYLTTQPINNGKPFIGSQVGTTLKTNPSYFSTTASPTSELFNIGKTDKTVRPVSVSRFSTFAPFNITVPAQGSFNVGTSTPKTVSSTGRVTDYATVYGKFVKSEISTPSRVTSTTAVTPTQEVKLSTTTATTNKRILLSKSLFSTSATPFSKPTQESEILSASDSFNRGNPQVRFFGRVQNNNKIPGVEIHFNGNSNSISTTAKPFSSTAVPLAVDGFRNSNSISTTPKPFSSTAIPLSANSFSTTSTKNPEINSVTPLNTLDSELNSVTPTSFDVTTRRQFGSTNSGFFVTKNLEQDPTQKSRISEIVRPRPFQLPPDVNFGGKAVYTTIKKTSPNPTYPTYKISSASPFADLSTLEPTQPTPFTTAVPTLPSTFENVDSMITALAEMATHNNFSDSPRPGLVIPPSAGPQTLHTLAVYFANALDGIASDKEEEEHEGEEEEDDENLTKVELEKKKLTELLTQMTMNRYNELFGEEKEEKEEEEQETTTVASRSGFSDLEGQHSKGPIQETPKVRQLAKVFTQALSSYLDDPATFKKVLEEVRPTEPPELETEEPGDLGDDELLNFSDADSKSSFPPFFSTPSSVRPTWGYLLAYNTSQNLDIKNSLNPDLENLQGADSQSFVSQFNKLHSSNKERESTTSSSVQLPEDHWTSSPNVNKLWKTAFSFNPASINENFGTTEPTITTTEEEEVEVPEPIKEENHHEIKYELKSLPQLELNSTQVHGILIDFMNTTKHDDTNRLQRILRKLNTTENEFLTKMKEIENNALTRRLILLLISECGENAAQQAIPIHSLLSGATSGTEILETASSIGGVGVRQEELTKSGDHLKIVDPNLTDDNQDARALQLLNSLYTIASRFGK